MPGFATYREILRIGPVRQVLALALFTRVPLWAGSIVITLHVVSHLHRSYAMAGLVAAVQAAALGVSGPYRGRRLDRAGLRRAVAPSVVVLAVCWCVAPFVGYWPFLAFVVLTALFTVPTFAITRQVLIGHTSLRQRTGALAVDGIVSDITFMVGPIVGVLLATTMPTPYALLICQVGSAVGAALIWYVDPPLHAPGHEAQGPAGGSRLLPSWLSPTAVVVLAMAGATTFILVGEDLAAVAAMRHWRTPEATGWVLALWGAGSLVGGLLYGALPRHPPAALVMLVLAVSAGLVAVAPDRAWFIVLLTLSGGLSAPAVTAVADELSRAVPAGSRGEALGWLGSATTVGNAGGAPVTGVAIDGFGWPGGLVVTGGVGLVVAAAGLLARARSGAAPA